jgi:hypothetical protein
MRYVTNEYFNTVIVTFILRQFLNGLSVGIIPYFLRPIKALLVFLLKLFKEYRTNRSIISPTT